MPATDSPRTHPYLLAGELRADGAALPVHNPWDGSLVGHAAAADAAAVRAAIDAAAAAAPAARAMPAHARARLLHRVRCGLAGRREELAQLLAREAGKPIANARMELDRTLFVLEYAAEEAKRLGGEVFPTDLLPQGERRIAVARRFPLAPIAGILPFNFPLLLAAHKLGPALAVGATMVLKAPPQDPLSTLVLGAVVGDALRECGWPAGTLSVVACSVDDAAPLLDDPRVRMVSFTGSARAGWAIRARAATKRVVLELGGNAGVVVEPDADLDHVARRCAAGGYAYSGQSCISTQRILVHESVHDAFVERFVAAVRALRTGDPLDERTDVGPMIDEASAERVEGWIRDAAAAGARIAAGGGRRGAVLEPTVLLDAAPAMQVVCEEVFAPVVAVRRYARFEDALAELDDSPYGLQAGLFTHDLRRILLAHERVELGALIVNDIPGWRVDSLPYGGVKASGMGREGVRSAMEEMTELRLLVLG